MCLPVNTILPKTAFTDEDRDGVVYKNWDPSVISSKIMGVLVHHLMVDYGAFCNIIFKKTLDQIGQFTNYIEKYDLIIKGFRDATVKPYGMFRLAIELVSRLDVEVCDTYWLDFVVIHIPSTFKWFLSRPFDHEFGAASSSFFYRIKFPTSEGTINTIKGDQKTARECLTYIYQDLNSAIYFQVCHESEVLQDCQVNQTTLQIGELYNNMEIDCEVTQKPDLMEDDEVLGDLPDLESRLGFEPMEEEFARWVPIDDPWVKESKQRTSPMEVTIGAKIPGEMRNQVIDFLKHIIWMSSHSRMKIWWVSTLSSSSHAINLT